MILHYKNVIILSSSLQPKSNQSYKEKNFHALKQCDKSHVLKKCYWHHDIEDLRKFIFPRLPQACLCDQISHERAHVGTSRCARIKEAVLKGLVQCKFTRLIINQITWSYCTELDRRVRGSFAAKVIHHANIVSVRRQTTPQTGQEQALPTRTSWICAIETIAPFSVDND